MIIKGNSRAHGRELARHLMNLRAQGLILARGNRRSFVVVDAAGEIYSLSRWCGVKPKALRKRLSDPNDLPSVDEVSTLFAAAATTAPNEQARETAEDRKAIDTLVATQRAERLALEAAQEERRTAAREARQKRLPKGLRAAWFRLTGKYDALLAKLTAEAEQADAQDAVELQTLVERHLSERRALSAYMVPLQARLAATADTTDAVQSVYRPDPLQPLILPREAVPFSAKQLRDNPALILEHLSDKKARFTRKDILKALAEYLPRDCNVARACDQALASADVIVLDQDAFTTRGFEVARKGLVQTCADLARQHSFNVSKRICNRAIRSENAKLKSRVGASLSDEQIAAIDHVLRPDHLSNVVGLTGAGKSTLLSVARAAWEGQGLKVYGAALAGKAADSLQSASGIPSRTLASLEASWKLGYEPIYPGSVLVIDEAGMVGTRQLARVAAKLKDRGCKLVLVGDPEQLQPIEAGTPFRDIAEDHGAARLTEIRRQSEDWQRQASQDLAAGHIEAALQAYDDHDAVKRVKNREAAIAKLAEDYLQDCKANPSQTRLALTHRRIDVHALNQAIRAARRLDGLIETETIFQTDQGPRAIAPGDRILFTRNDRVLGVRNGMLGSVEAVGTDQLSVVLDTSDTEAAHKLTIKPAHFPHIDHGFATSIHRAQGATVDQTFVLASKTMDRHLKYVAMTRHRSQTKLYAAEQVTPELAPLSRNLSLPSLQNRRPILSR